MIKNFISNVINTALVFSLFFIAHAINPNEASAACNNKQAKNALALNIYHEARNQSIDGMLMVGEVTMNRVESDHFPDTICGVVYQGRRDENNNMIRHKCQFSWYCDGSSDTPNEQEEWELSQKIAAEIIRGDVDFLNTGATHYLNANTVSRMPRWTRVYEFVGVVGDHKFYAMGDRL